MSARLTVRYSHLSPDFLQDIVEKLVPPEFETEDENRTDTRTDTEEIASAEPASKSVH